MLVLTPTVPRLVFDRVYGLEVPAEIYGGAVPA